MNIVEHKYFIYYSTGPGYSHIFTSGLLSICKVNVEWLYKFLAAGIWITARLMFGNVTPYSPLSGSFWEVTLHCILLKKLYTIVQCVQILMFSVESKKIFLYRVYKWDKSHMKVWDTLTELQGSLKQFENRFGESRSLEDLSFINIKCSLCFFRLDSRITWSTTWFCQLPFKTLHTLMLPIPLLHLLSNIHTTQNSF